MYLSYRGFVGPLFMDGHTRTYFGKLDTYGGQNVSYKGRTVTEAQLSYRSAVNQYIASFELRDEDPGPLRTVNVCLKMPACMAHVDTVSINDVLDLVRETIILE